MAVDPDSRMFMFDPVDKRSLDARLSAEGIRPDDHDLPPRTYRSNYQIVGSNPINRARATQVALGFKKPQDGTRPALNADKTFAREPLERAEKRLQFLRQVQTLIDETDARIALQKMQERESWWLDDEAPLREAVDSWQDELPERERDFKFKYKTPKPKSARLDKMADVLTQMGDVWLSVDLDLQSRGYRPAKDKNQYRRESGTTDDKKREQLGAGGIGAALRQSMPELFGVESPQARDGKLRRESPKTSTQKLSARIDPWDELKMIMSKGIDRAAESIAREERKFEGMSRKRRHGVD